MISGRSSRALGACATLFASVSLSTIAHAQLAGEVAPPEQALVDENGVNVATGQYRLPRTDLVVGSGPGALSDARIYGRQTWQDARITLYNAPPGPMTVSTGDKTYIFARSGSGFATGTDGARLVVNAGVYQIILTDGTKYTYGQIEQGSRHADSREYDYDAYAYLSAIDYPSGLKITVGWLTSPYCAYGSAGDIDGSYCRLSAQTSSGPAPQIWMTRLASISSNAGYRIDYQYAGSSLVNGRLAPTTAQIADWKRQTGATGANAQGGTGPLPSVTYNYANTSVSGGYVSTDDVTDALNRTWRYTKQVASAGYYEAMRRPGSSADNVRINTDANYRVTSIVKDGATWTYAFATPSSNVSTLTVTDPTNRTRKYQSDLTVGLPTRVEDEYGRAIAYAYDTSRRLSTATSPGGQVTTYGYDADSNVTSTTVTSAGGGATLGSSATYANFSCPTAGTCSRMTSSTDVRGVVTTYTYDDTHGGVTSAVTQNPGGVSPSVQTRYTQVNGIWLSSATWTCRTQANCENAADATKTSITYNANMLPTSVTVGAGDGSLTTTTATTYTAAGDVLTVDGPLAGAADTTRYYYDAARQRLGVVGPDPDGGGVLLNRAARTGYDGWGRATSVAQGTTSGQGDSALSNMTVMQTQTATLDDAGRAKSVALSSGSTVFSRMDYAYDAAGRSTCTAVRMTGLGAVADACAVGADATYGSDRVTRVQYSAAGTGNPASVTLTSGYGTPAASTETVLQTVTGKTASVTDANGNVTSYAYDGFDRPWRTCYQTATSAACAGSPGDYEQYGYDAKGDVKSRRLRDGQAIGYVYDTLGRLVSKDVSNAVYWETDKGYDYNLIGQLTGARDNNGRSLGFVYDALGRKVSQSDNWYGFGSATFQYDLAGRRTRTTWNDGFWVGYDYLVTGETRVIRDNGGAALVTFGYDALGRRASLARANGTVTNYGFDAASRLTSLTQDLAGTSSDLTLGFTYNPAGQIVSRTSSNDAYAWGGATNVSRGYTVNGLNQYTQSGATALGYDGRGNLTSSGSSSYGYTSENRMATAPGANLAYDPLDRLFNFGEGAVNTTVTYDGADAIAEIDQSNGALLRRYVQGPGSDEPLIWYEGSGTSDRRWLHADERGSIIAVTNDAGTATAINSYDEYGIPASGNVGRFQYTGQKWLPSVGLYDYKARMYSPTLGRFMQTDPIGYGDGLNWYNYVGGDPVNMADPSGLADIEIGVTATWKYQDIGFDLSRFFREYSGFTRMSDYQIGVAPDDEGNVIVTAKKRPQKGCSAGGAAMRARIDGLASNLGPVTFDSANEVGLLAQYFRGDTTPYRLSGAEMAQARAYVGTYGNSVLGSTVRAGAGGTTERSIFFGKIPSDAPLLDGLLGTATGIFRGSNLVGIRDTFNFDYKNRGGYPYGTFANAGVAMIRADAASCAGNVSIPVSGG